MSNTLIAFLLSLGIGAWVYNFFMKRTGSQMKPALTVAAIAAVFVFIVVLMVVSFLPSN